MRQSAGLFDVWVWAEIKVDFAKSLNCIYARMSINQAIYQTCHLFLGTQWELERDGSIWICSSFAVGHLIHIDTRNSPGPSRFIDKTDMRPTCDCLQRMWHFEAPQSVRKSTKLTTLRVFVCVGLCLIRSLRVSVCVCVGIVLRLLSMFWWCPSGSYKPQCQNRTACQSTWTVMSALWVCVCVCVSRSVFVCFVMQNQAESIMRCLKSQTNANKWGLRPGLVALEAAAKPQDCCSAKPAHKSMLHFLLTPISS